MQDNRYNDNDDWYGTYSHDTAQNSSEIPQNPDKQKKRRTRVTALIICICVFIAAAVCAYFYDRSRRSTVDAKEILPKNWQDYMDGYYTDKQTGTQAEISIPSVKPDPEFSLKISNNAGAMLSPQRIYTKCAPSVVCLTARSADKISAYSWGSGIIVSPDGYILTNTHIISGCDTVTVELYSGEEFEASLVGADFLSDISILKIDASGLTPAEFVSASTLSVGDEVIAIGNPLGETYRLSMTDGIISGVSREVNYNGTVMNLLQTNAAINEGNSGGALINGAGQIIGITNMKIISSTGVEGIGFAIPSDTAVGIADSLLKNGAVIGRASIGITVGTIPEPAAEYYELPRGLYVSEVNENSDAYTQGIREGDIITEVNGVQVHESSEITDIKKDLKVGDSLKFTVWRDGKTFSASVKLMDANNF